MRGPGLPGGRGQGCRVTRVGGNGPEPLPRAPDCVLKPLHPAMAPRPPPRLPGSRPWARPALGAAGVTRAGQPGRVGEVVVWRAREARAASRRGWLSWVAALGEVLQAGLSSVSTSPRSWSSGVRWLHLHSSLAPLAPPPPVPQVQCPSSWSLTHRRACPALPSPCSGRITTVISRPVSPTRGDSQGPPCDWKDGRHGHLACSGFARPGGRRPSPAPPWAYLALFPVPRTRAHWAGPVGGSPAAQPGASEKDRSCQVKGPQPGMRPESCPEPAAGTMGGESQVGPDARAGQWLEGRRGPRELSPRASTLPGSGRRAERGGRPAWPSSQAAPAPARRSWQRGRRGVLGPWATVRASLEPQSCAISLAVSAQASGDVDGPGGAAPPHSGPSNPPLAVSGFPHTLLLGTALGAKRLFKQVGLSVVPLWAGRAGFLQRLETPAQSAGL